MKAIFLKPIGGYKTELRSDTLWGLLCWGLRHLEGEARLNQFIQSYLDGRPELVISSAFPYKQVGDGRIKFFPKPCSSAALEEPEDDSDPRIKYRLRKMAKKANWLNEKDFALFLKGEFTEEHIKQRLKVKSNETVAELVVPRRQVETVMHTTIDRLQLSTHSVDMGDGETRGQLYLSDEIHWEDTTKETSDKTNTGLFFLAEGNTSWLLPVLRLYRHLGLGGNRTTGKGFFDPSMEDFSFPEVAGANALVNLSLYRPSLDDLMQLQSKKENHILRYVLEERKGKVGFVKGNYPKSPFTYFKEGSVFPVDCFPSEGMIGNLVLQEIQLDFPVYDNGVGFFCKMKI